jgi:putative endonuclease
MYQQKKSQNKVTGSIGEQLAATYLEKQNYTILFRNYSLHWGEIDLIAEKENTLIFVEVKTRVGYLKGKPYENMTFAKRKHLLRSAHYFLKMHPYPDHKYTIDVISLVLSTSGTVIEFRHFQNILA